MRVQWRRFLDWFHRDKLTAELDEELRFHLSRLERDAQATGMNDDDAYRAARLRLGNITTVAERSRAVWGAKWADELGQDLRYAARSLRRSPGFAAAVIITLALGLGANTGLFSIVNAVLLRPLPYAQPERLVTVWTSPAGSPSDRNPTSYPDLIDWKARNAVFDGIGAYVYNRFEITGAEGTDQARAAIGTSDLFTVLGAQALLGRLPLPSDERAAVVTISHTLWMRRYAGNRDILGRTLVLNEQPYTIIGVARAGFRFPTPDVDLWMSLQPITGSAAQPAATPWITGRGFHAYRAVARLKPGVTLGSAEAAMNAVQQQLGIEYPDFAGTNVRLRPLRDDALGAVQRPLWLMLGAAGFVLLLACANVAHLVLARASTRQREMAVRRALGAGRGRLIRQLLTESTLLALLSGVVGIGVAAAGTRLLVSLRARDIPRLETASIDVAVLLFAVAVSVLTGLLFGLAPAVAGSRREAQAFLREESRGLTSGRAGTRFRSALTAAEVALALILLVGAGLMLRSFGLLLATDPGFRPDGVLSFHINFPSARYPAGSPQTTTVDRVLARVRALPGVLSAGASTNLPPSRMQQASGFAIEGEPATEPGRGPSAVYVPATPGFFATLGVPVRVGRDFTAGDDSGASPVAIINSELARRRFTRRDPLGRRITMNGTMRTIVGVSGDPTYGGIGAPMSEQVYVPFAQSPFPGAWCVVRTTGNPAGLFRPITDAVHAVDPLINPSNLLTMDDVIADSLVRPRFNTWLLGTFGALALMLASIGIYGVIAYGVARRTREIGVRIALGAQRSRVVSGVVGRGMTPVLIGLGVGVAGALMLSKVMTGLLYGIGPTDVVTFVAVTGLLGAVAFVAAYVPALRASRVDPIVALRAE